MARQVGAVTAREVEVLLAVADADDLDQAGAGLGISPHVVRTTTARLRAKLGVKTNLQALRKLVGGVRFVTEHNVTARLEKLDEG